ncbi:hypothetical protein F2Q69_00030072 [Brassica cretica]|uniref:Uncharacterized protein n=1 Tax=Brassica cretica TaxID=69181 RepID=A0A8S9RVA0_BRACR|nr:hypothetical protein F2Q69_00030072 [Brassica cretica]
MCEMACVPVMQTEIWEEWWHPECVLAMLRDMWSTRCRRACVRSHAKRHTGGHQPESDWLLSSINSPRPQIISSHTDLYKPTPRDGSVQLNSSRPLSSFDDQVEFCPELVQFYGFRSVEVLLDTPPGSPKNCPEARGDKIIPVHSSHVVNWVLAKSSPINQLLIGKEHCSRYLEVGSWQGAGSN